MRRVSVFAFFAWLTSLAGCAAVDTGGDIAQGRQAMFRGDYPTALAEFQAAAKTDPKYMYGDVLSEGVYSFVGRAQYLSGQYPQRAKAWKGSCAEPQS